MNTIIPDFNKNSNYSFSLNHLLIVYFVFLCYNCSLNFGDIMHKSIATILESFKTFFSDEQIESSHSLMYQKYNIYDFRFSKKIAYFLEELTGLSASSMLQQHALAQFDNFVKSIEPIPTKIYPNSTISFFDKIINIEISMELMLTFTPTDGWYVGSYGSRRILKIFMLYRLI